jgi:hypothetical protein
VSLSINKMSRVALGAALVALAPAIATAATTNKGVLTYATGLSSTNAALLLLGVDVNPIGAATESGGLLSPTSFNLPITKVTTNATGLSSVAFGTSGLEFEKSFLIFSKEIDFNGLTFDFATKTLSGKTGSSTIGLFTAQSVTGSVTGGLSSGSFSYTASGLYLTSAAVSKISSALGVSSLALSKVNFGSLKITGAIPEPSTYALIGMGLAGAAFVARRRRAEEQVH